MIASRIGFLCALLVFSTSSAFADSESYAGTTPVLSGSQEVYTVPIGCRYGAPSTVLISARRQGSDMVGPRDRAHLASIEIVYANGQVEYRDLRTQIGALWTINAWEAAEVELGSRHCVESVSLVARQDMWRSAWPTVRMVLHIFVRQ